MKITEIDRVMSKGKYVAFRVDTSIGTEVFQRFKNDMEPDDRKHVYLYKDFLMISRESVVTHYEKFLILLSDAERAIAEQTEEEKARHNAWLNNLAKQLSLPLR